jgi:anti-sigma regulatory factor (Ser/Thr protein kinase)
MGDAPPSSTGSVPREKEGMAFPPTPSSAPAARRFVASLALTGDEELSQRLSTLVSELATNAILHARTAFTVHASRADGVIRVAVSDESDEPPVLRGYDNTQPTGRGLHFVEALSDRWGYTSRARGKTVWFELDPVTSPI